MVVLTGKLVLLPSLPMNSSAAEGSRKPSKIRRGGGRRDTLPALPNPRAKNPKRRSAIPGRLGLQTTLTKALRAGMIQMKPAQFMEPRRSLRVREALPIRFAIASEKYLLEHKGITVDRSPHGLRIRAAIVLSRGETAVIFSQGKLQTAVPTRVVWVDGGDLDFKAVAGL